MADRGEDGQQVSGYILPGVGGFLLAVSLVILLLFGPLPNGEDADLVIAGGIGSVLLAYGHWVTSGRAGFAPETYPLITKWCLGGSTGLLLVVVALRTASGDFVTDWDLLTSMVLAASIGAAGGALTGTRQARAVQSAREAERARLERERTRAERDHLDFLNSFLRHEVLNNANLIKGYAELVRQERPTDSAASDHLELIAERADAIATTIDDVKLLVQATTEEPAFRSINLTDVLSKEIASVQEVYPDANIETTIPESLPVQADEMLPRLFSNLLRNAIEHNDSDEPLVKVTAETTNDTSVVLISDNGPGIPPDVRTELFDRSAGNHGLGLYLVSTLVDRYGGTIDLTETGPDGSTFTVHLPLAHPASTAE